MNDIDRKLLQRLVRERLKKVWGFVMPFESLTQLLESTPNAVTALLKSLRENPPVPPSGERSSENTSLNNLYVLPVGRNRESKSTTKKASRSTRSSS